MRYACQLCQLMDKGNVEATHSVRSTRNRMSYSCPDHIQDTIYNYQNNGVKLPVVRELKR